MDIKTQAQEILKNVTAAKKLITQIEGTVKRQAEGKATEVDTKLMTATLDKLEALLVSYQPEPELPVKLTELEAIGLKAVIDNSIDSTGGDFGFISEARPESIDKRTWPGVVGSLVRKGLIWTVPLSEQGATGANADDSQCNPTKLGAEVAKLKGWIDERQCSYFKKDM